MRVEKLGACLGNSKTLVNKGNGIEGHFITRCFAFRLDPAACPNQLIYTWL